MGQPAGKELRVTYSDGRQVNVVLRPKAQVAVERHFNKSVMDMNRIEEMYYMAWAALSATKEEARDFDSFLDVIDDVELAGEQGADPTGAAPSADSSSS